jgi:hypothetical protein
MSEKPTIMSPYGPVTEAGRLQAAYNMRDDPACKERVIELLTKQLGSRERAEAEARRRYPEAFV